MVKPDIKVNYYAALELPNTATDDEIKSQYRKLALKYHPDRNPGKEEDVVPKFQAIQAANEILGDATTRAKYDADRRRAGLLPGSTTSAARGTASAGGASGAGAKGNPYSASNAWPPPPRRTQDPTAWAKGNPRASQNVPNSGADRFTNFPRPAPTGKKDSEQERTNAFNAWQNMNTSRKQTPTQQQPSPKPQTTRPRPPPPPRADTRFPSEEQIRAGMNYRQAPSNFASEESRSAWAQFNDANTGRPGMNRTPSVRTPRRGGFDPNAPGSDERPAAATSNYSARREVPPPPPFPPPPPNQPPAGSNIFGQAHPSHIDTDVPYTEGTRVRTPYTSNSNEKTFFSSDQLKRSQSTRDTTKLNEDGSSQNRHRSASPLKPSADNKDGSRQKPFVVDDDSSDTSTDSTPNDSAQQPDASNDNPFLRNGNRPIKTPKPPSRRTTGTPRTTKFADTPSADAGPGDKGSDTMYDDPSSSASAPFKQDWFFHSRESAGYAKIKSKIPPWAWPSTVNPYTTLKTEQRPPSIVISHVGNVTAEMTPNEATKSWPLSPHSMSSDSSGGVRLPLSPQVAENQNVFRFTMPINPDTFQPTNANRSRSEETINTAFSESEWSGKFTGGNLEGMFAVPSPTGRKQSPLKRGRESLSSRGSRSQMNSSKSGFVPPPISTSTNVPDNTNEPISAPAEAKFVPDTWKDSAWDFTPSASPGPGSKQHPLRRASEQINRTQSGSGTAIPAPAEAEQIPAHNASAADAMDIDQATPPVTSGPSSQVKEAKARSYAVPPSAWRQSQGAALASETRRRSSAAAAPNVNLADLAATLNGSAGFEGMHDLSSTLPFQSQPSSTHPTRSFAPSTTPLPPLPNAPAPPIRLTKASWKTYCASFAAYLSAFHAFNKDIHVHFREGLMHEAQLVSMGVEALEAAGQSGDVGLNSYARLVKDEERWQECWRLGSERHRDAVALFESVKERVRKVSEGPGLADA